jgi:hypothetical protein
MAEPEISIHAPADGPDIELNTQGILVRLDNFFTYGFIIGGLVHPSWVAIYDLCSENPGLVPLNYKRPFLVTLISSALVCIILFRFGYSSFNRSESTAVLCLRSCAFFCIIALHVLVLSTGGSTQSFFAYHYLYIPAVVAISFRGSKEFVCASFLCFLSFTTNLFCFTNPWIPLDSLCFRLTPEWTRILAGPAYGLAHLMVFTIQLLMLGVLRRKNVDATTAPA